MMLAGTVGALVAAGVAHGAFHRNSPLFGRVITRAGTEARDLALTFDDGPNPDATPRVLDALGSRAVRATFFVLGRHARQWPAVVRAIVDAGHVVGNHGFHHQRLHLRSPAFVREDIRLGALAIEDAAGVTPRLFRAPHGFRSPWVSRIARSMGQLTVGWSLGVWDSDNPGVDVIAERTVRGAGAQSIVLLHDGDGYDPRGDRRQTAAAVPLIVDALQARGRRFVALDG